MKKPKIFRVDEAQAAVLLYNEGTPLTQQQFDSEVEQMRHGIREIEANGQEAQAKDVQGESR